MTQIFFDILCRIIFLLFDIHFGIKDAVIHVLQAFKFRVFRSDNCQIHHLVDMFLIFFSFYGITIIFLQMCNTLFLPKRTV